MSTQLLSPLRSLRTTLRRLAIARGVALAVTLLLGLVIVTGTLDWFVHIDDHGTRLLLGLSICGLVAFVLWRWVAEPSFARLSDLQVAQRIERVHPELEGQLSTSVEFVSGSQVGSDELRERTVAGATQTLGQLAIEDLPDRRSVNQALMAAGLAVVLAATLFFTRPLETRTAVSRLIAPFQDIPWPRTTDFRVISEAGETLPDSIALTVVRGEYQEILIENTQGELPADAAVEYRLGRNGKSRFESLQPVNLETATPGDVGRAVLSPGKSPVYFRATGGDHKSLWYRLDVVSPPRLTAIDVTIQHPPYTERPDETLPQNSAAISALVGSTIHVKASLNEPIAAASVSVQGKQVDAEVSADGTSLALSFDVEREGVSSWWIDLTGRSGITNPRPPRYELRAASDMAPSVFIERPLSDLQVTANASVPIRVTATDDQGIDFVSLIWRTNDADSDETEIPLVATDGQPGTTFDGAVDFTLDGLDLPVGTRLILQASADDRFDGDVPHLAVSEPRTLTIVSAAVRKAELARSQADLMDELQRVLNSQQRTRENIADLQIQQRETGQLRRTDLDLLKRTEIDQHRIASTLFDETDGLQYRIQRLADQFTANKIESPRSQAELDSLIGELNHIQADVMPALQSQLTDSRKAVQNSMNAPDSGNLARVDDLEQQLQGVENRQTEVIDSLASVLQNADAWKKQVDLSSTLTDITERQTRLIAESTKLAERALQSDPNTDRQQATDGARLGRQQQRLADRLDDLLDEVGSAITELTQTDPSTAARLQAGRDFTDQRTPSVKMREAASELEAGRTGAAADMQSQAASDLKELARLFERPAAQPNDVLMDNFAEVAEALKELAEQQDDIARNLQNAKSDQDAATAAARQSDIRSLTERQQRKLERSSASDAASNLATAVEEMKTTEQAANNGDTSAAAQAAEAASNSIRKALDAANERREQIKRQAMQSELLALVQQLTETVAEQKIILNKTLTFEQAVQTTGRRTRKQSREILNLGTQQEQLAAQVDSLTDTMKSEPVIALMLDSATSHMRRARTLLAKRDTSTATTGAQSAAVQDIQQMVAVLQPSQSDSPESPSQPNENPQQDTQSPPDDGRLVSLLAKLKLLRALQLTINQRTQALRDQPSQSAQIELKALADRQQRIADLAAEMLSEVTQEATP